MSRKRCSRKRYLSAFPSENQIVDVITKSLSKMCFTALRNKLKVKAADEGEKELMSANGRKSVPGAKG